MDRGFHTLDNRIHRTLPPISLAAQRNPCYLWNFAGDFPTYHKGSPFKAHLYFGFQFTFIIGAMLTHHPRVDDKSRAEDDQKTK